MRISVRLSAAKSSWAHRTKREGGDDEDSPDAAHRAAAGPHLGEEREESSHTWVLGRPTDDEQADHATTW